MKPLNLRQLETEPYSLSPFECWAVGSNLKRIKEGEPKEKVIATLKANGYLRLAMAVEDLTKG